MDCRMPGFPVLHYLTEFAQAHVYWVSDTIQPSHPLSCPSPPAFNLSQHYGSFLRSRLFTSGGQSVGASALTSVLPMNIQDWFPLELTGLMSFLSKGLSRVFFSTTVKKHQFFCAQLSLQSSSHIHTWLLDSPIPKRMKFCHLQNWMKLENIMLSEINWTKINTIWNHLYVESKR